ncbi:MAG: Hsp20/alpha crystallin family protein [Bacteroidetes bacterium]|nr:hypothetical protein AWN76_002655 [Rhodothermaceae bacterium RA]RMH49761.1 MAG: Hsp20/alpha crystallin family protein [Bacteroidota bacterium]
MANLMLRNPLTELQREVDRLFETFLPTNDVNVPTVFTPAVDMWETDSHYIFAFDLPGLTKEDVSISYQDGMLQISGERKAPQEENATFHRVERPYGRFFRSIRLDRGIQVDGIEAHFEHGVLTVEVPKAEEVKPRRIEIS